MLLNAMANGNHNSIAQGSFACKMM